LIEKTITDKCMSALLILFCTS